MESKVIKPTEEFPTYTITCSCHNCGYSGDVAIIRGRSLGGAPCPSCSCPALERVYIPTIAHRKDL